MFFLSPFQHSKFSSSLDSLSSQTQIVNPNVWESVADAKRGTYLTATDIDNLKHLVQDFSIRSLIPYIEKQIVSLNDTVANKKSVSRSLLSATKRFFATKPGASSQTENVVVYSSDSSLELQTRKLGDLYFLFGNYSQAFQQYHQVKRDFQVDSAWQYYAGALEMAGKYIVKRQLNWLNTSECGANCLTFFVLLRFICVFVEYSELIKSKSICLPRRGDCRLFESMQVSSKFKWFSIFKWLLVPVIIQCHFVSRLDYKIWPYDVLFWALSCWNPCNFIRKVLDNLFEWQVQMPI